LPTVLGPSVHTRFINLAEWWYSSLKLTNNVSKLTPSLSFVSCLLFQGLIFTMVLSSNWLSLDALKVIKQCTSNLLICVFAIFVRTTQCTECILYDCIVHLFHFLPYISLINWTQVIPRRIAWFIYRYLRLSLSVVSWVEHAILS